MLIRQNLLVAMVVRAVGIEPTGLARNYLTREPAALPSTKKRRPSPGRRFISGGDSFFGHWNDGLRLNPRIEVTLQVEAAATNLYVAGAAALRPPGRQCCGFHAENGGCFFLRFGYLIHWESPLVDCGDSP